MSWKPVKRIRFCGDQELLQPASRFEGRYLLFDQTVYAELALIRNLRVMDLQATICSKRHDIQGRLAVVVNRKGQSPSQCCTALR